MSCSQEAEEGHAVLCWALCLLHAMSWQAQVLTDKKQTRLKEGGTLRLITCGAC